MSSGSDSALRQGLTVCGRNEGSPPHDQLIACKAAKCGDCLNVRIPIAEQRYCRAVERSRSIKSSLTSSMTVSRTHFVGQQLHSPNQAGGTRM